MLVSVCRLIEFGRNGRILTRWSTIGDKDDSTRIIPALDPEALARAEPAVAALGDGFVDRLKGELVEIRAHAEALAQTVDAQNNSSVEAVLTFTHDLRGQDGTFGYPLLSEIGRLDALVRKRLTGQS